MPTLGRAATDANFRPTLIGVSSLNFSTPAAVAVNPSTGAVLIEGSISVSGSDGALQDGVDTAIKASVLDYTNANPLAVRLTDTNGDYAAAGAGTQYTEDAAAAADPIGNTVLMTRDDQLSTVTEVEGDWSRVRGTSKGALWVALADSNGDPITSFGGGTQYAEDTASGAADVITMAGAVRKDTAASLVDTDGDRTELQVDSSGRLHVNVGNSVTVSNAGLTELAAAINGSNQMDVNIAASTTLTVGSHAVTNAGTFVTQIDGAALTALQLIDDPVATLGTTTYTEAATKGMIIGAVRRDANTTLVDTTNEVTPLQVNATGELKVAQIQALPAGSAIIGKMGIDQTTPGTTNLVALTAETTKVIGVTRTADGAGNLLTSNSTTYTAKFGLDANILGTLGTAFTTAGKVDVKAADGDVFVRQATAANLNMTEASAASILTSSQLIDDMIYTDDTSTHATGTSKGALIMAAATPTDTAVNANDIGAVGMTNNREMYVSLRDIAGTAAVNGSGNATGALRVELPTNGTGVISTVSTVTSLTQMNGQAIALNTGTRSAGTQRVTIATDDLVPVSDNSGSLTVDAPVGTPVFATITPSTTGGWSVKSLVALTNTKTAIKAGAGTFGGYMFYNPNSSVVYLQVWDVAIGSITVGTTAATYVIPIPATAGANVEFTNGIKHSTEINIAATTTATGSTAPSTAIDGFALYK